MSSMRKSTPESIGLSENCRATLTGAIYMNMAGIKKSNFIPPSIKINFHDKVVFVDPLVIDDSIKADYIFITHNHADHLSLADIDKISKPTTLIVGPKSIEKTVKGRNHKIIPLNKTLNFNSFSCRTVESYNLKKGSLSFTLHTKTDDFLGYVFTCDSISIYIAGDTDFILEMSKLKNITLAFLPIGIGQTAMNPQKAAEAANLISPHIVVPIHYELGLKKEEEFKQFVKRNIEVMLL
jgi:L-ascorbate metabolism protein UlaG (beta-lactamase superfamily)